MKRNTLHGALCAVALASSSAYAQSTSEVYGLIDLMVGQTTNFSKDQGSAVRLSSGGMNVSRIGFRGGEDLGGGLKAIYQLEAGFAADTGVPDNPLFKRQAYVGLEGQYGRLVLGRSFTAVYDFVLPYDPMGYAPFYSWAPTGNATGASKYGMTLAFDNMVKYTGKVGNLSVGLSYGAGEQASTADSAKIAVAVNYASGAYAAVAAYERVNGNTLVASGTRDVTTAWHVGAMASAGPLKLQAAVRDYAHKPALLAPEVSARLYWFGANYLIMPALTLTGAVYYQHIRNVSAASAADPIMYVGRARHAMSKRTDLYMTLAYAKARHGQLVGLARDDVGYCSSQRSVAAGIQHRF